VLVGVSIDESFGPVITIAPGGEFVELSGEDRIITLLPPVDEDTVRTLILYRYQYQGGWQPILIDERRDPLENTPFNVSITLCEDGEQVIAELLETSSPEEKQEVEHIREFLQSAGYQLDPNFESDE